MRWKTICILYDVVVDREKVYKLRKLCLSKGVRTVLEVLRDVNRGRVCGVELKCPDILVGFKLEKTIICKYFHLEIANEKLHMKETCNFEVIGTGSGMVRAEICGGVQTAVIKNIYCSCSECG